MKQMNPDIKAIKNKQTKILKRCEREYFSNLLKDYKHDAKKIWKLLNNIMNKKVKPQPNPKYFVKTDEKITGNGKQQMDSMNMLQNIGPNLTKKIPKSDRHFKEFLNENVKNLIFLESISNQEVFDIVKRMKTKMSFDKDRI